MSIEQSTWLEARSHGLTGTDAAAIVGASPWKTPFMVWADKTGRLEREDLSDKEFIQWGATLEPVVVAEYAKRTGRGIQYDTAALAAAADDYPACSPHMLPHTDGTDMLMLLCDEMPVLRCTPDFGITGWNPLGTDAEEVQHAGPGIGEAKTANAFAAKDWDSGAPLHYQTQVQHMLLVSGLEWGSIPVLLGGSAFRIVDMARDDAFLQYLLEESGKFWDEHVLKDIPPDLQAEDLATVKRMHPRDDGSHVVLAEYVKDLDVRRELLKARLKADDHEMELLDALLRRYIGDAKLATIPNSGGVNYTLNTTKRRPSKCGNCDHELKPASEYRVLRRKVVAPEPAAE